MKEKTLRYPGHAELIIALQRSGFFSTESIRFKQEEIIPLQYTSATDAFPSFAYTLRFTPYSLFTKVYSHISFVLSNQNLNNMNEKEKDQFPHRDGRVATGVFILLIGTVLLAYKMNAGIPAWLVSWASTPYRNRYFFSL